MFSKQCESCGKAFDAVRPTRRWCTDSCGRRYRRQNPAGAPQPLRPVPTPTDGDIDLLGAVQAELRAIGKLDTVLGKLAENLAERLTAAGSPAGAAAVSRELSRVLASIHGHPAEADDPLDELRRRRDRKRGGITPTTERPAND
ncbi:MAG TPA: hypothetical protein PLT93_11635 [Phycisphaerae bacterium]|nr:hypothetical protein [Phycisphaerae bacterium]